MSGHIARLADATAPASIGDVQSRLLSRSWVLPKSIRPEGVRWRMAFIDWSDPEEMFGLLVEYVADEIAESQHDPIRRRFLIELSGALRGLADRFAAMSPAGIIETLQAIRESQPDEFENDAVLVHVDDCIEELERIRSRASDRGSAEG